MKVGVVEMLLHYKAYIFGLAVLWAYVKVSELRREESARLEQKRLEEKFMGDE